jgi:hypothetical protein
VTRQPDQDSQKALIWFEKETAAKTACMLTVIVEVHLSQVLEITFIYLRMRSFWTGRLWFAPFTKISNRKLQVERNLLMALKNKKYFGRLSLFFLKIQTLFFCSRKRPL